MPGVVITTGPATEPVSTAEAKTHLRVSHSDDDTYIGNLIEAARFYIESECNRAMITQTLTEMFDDFPSGSRPLRLQKPRLQSVTSVSYVDSEGSSQTWSSSQYLVSTQSEPGYIEPAYGYSYPIPRDQSDAVTVTYVAGYGAATSAIPEDLRMAVLWLVAHWYDLRHPVVTGTIATKIPLNVESVLSRYRVGTPIFGGFC